jgi:hypothetical protein
LRARDAAGLEARAAIASKEKAEHESLAALAQEKLARKAQVDAERERDSAAQQVSLERAVASQATKERKEAEEHLRQISQKLTGLRTELALFESKNLIEIAPQAQVKLRAAMSDLDSKINEIEKSLPSGIFFKVAVTFPADVPEERIKAALMMLISQGAVPVPARSSKVNARDFTAVRYFRDEEEKRAIRLTDFLRKGGLPNVYIEHASAESALKPILKNTDIPLLEIRFGSDVLAADVK